jgi:cytoskeleton protein RodZ
MDVSNRANGEEKAATSIGQVLQNARKSRALTLEQISMELRIDAQQLLALEQNAFERIGPPVFVKGYLRQYGQRLGLDYRDLLGMYYEQAERQEVIVQPSRTIKLRDERQITVWIVAALVLAVLVMAALWWLNRNAPAAAASAPAPSLQGASAALVSPAPRAERAARSAQPAPIELAAVPQARVAEVAGASPVGVQLEVVLTFEQDSWAEATAGNGERLFYGLGEAGRRAVLAGEAPIDVLLGNARGVRLAVNGVEHAVPAGDRTNLARFTLTAQNMQTD